MGRSFFRKLLDDDSDEDEIIIKLLTGSTQQRKHRRYIERNHLAGHRRLYDDYFAEEPIYPPKLFQRRFQMRRFLFLLPLLTWIRTVVTPKTEEPCNMQ